MQFLTVLKSFRLSMVYRHGLERMDCYALFDGENGQLINTSINRQFYTAEIGYSFEFHKRKYKKCRNLKQQRHFKTLCLLFLFSEEL